MGVLAGAANGLLGGGGGMAVVPCLHYVGGVDERVSHATAIAIMAPLSLLSVLVYTVKGVCDFQLAWKVGIGVALGGFLGAILLRRIPKTLLSVVFYGAMIYAGVKFLS